MHSVDRHRDCVTEANMRTFERFGTYGPYRVGSDEHKFWLKAYDTAMVSRI